MKETDIFTKQGPSSLVAVWGTEETCSLSARKGCAEAVSPESGLGRGGDGFWADRVKRAPQAEKSYTRKRGDR